MSSDLNIILENIKNGKTVDLSSLTINDYLNKDVNGVTFIENLIIMNYKFSYSDEQKFKNSTYIAYLYCKYGKNLYNFELTEDQLYDSVDGKPFIEYLVSKDKLDYKFIKIVKKHIDIVDYILNSNHIWQLSNVNDEVINMLFEKDNDTYIIEKYFNNDDFIKQLIEATKSNVEIIDLCIKYDKFKLLENANEYILMSKFKDNNTLFDKLLEKNIIPKKLRYIPENKEFIDFLREKALYNYLKDADNDVLFMYIEDNLTVLEELLNKGYEPTNLSFISNKEHVNLLAKLNRLDLITNIYDNLLFSNVIDVIDNTLENTTLIEYLYSKGYNPLKNCVSIDNINIIKFLLNKNYYDIIGEKISNKVLFEKVNEEDTLIDFLLKNNIKIKADFSMKKNELYAKKLVEYNRYDLLVDVDTKILLKEIDNGKTYLDYLLENIKNKNIRFSINNLHKFDLTVEEIAKFYLIIAKNDMNYYIDRLQVEDLLKDYNGITLLETLLNLEPNITYDKLLTNEVKMNNKIAVILKSKGLEQKDINVIEDKELYSKEYLSNADNSLGIGPLMYEGEILLKKLEDLFKNDGNSDHSLIDSLISGYRHSLFIDYENTLFEINNLITIKENNIDDFFYKKCDDGAYFSRAYESVYSDSPTTSTLMHETAHALHYFLTKNKVPYNYDDLVENARNNPELLINVEKYANKYREIRTEIKKTVEEKYNEYFKHYYSKDKIKEIEEYLDKAREEKIKDFKELNMDEEVIKSIIESSFNKEEYINHQKRIFIEQYTEAILRTNYPSFVAIGDILDAIFDGELHNGVLKNKDGELINSCPGHGISYYFETRHGFDEMVANWSMILKSKNFDKNLDILKSLVGDDIFNMLKDFYYNEIVLNSYDVTESKTL